VAAATSNSSSEMTVSMATPPADNGARCGPTATLNSIPTTAALSAPRPTLAVSRLSTWGEESKNDK